MTRSVAAALRMAANTTEYGLSQETVHSALYGFARTLEAVCDKAEEGFDDEEVEKKQFKEPATTTKLEQPCNKAAKPEAERVVGKVPDGINQLREIDRLTLAIFKSLPLLDLQIGYLELLQKQTGASPEALRVNPGTLIEALFNIREILSAAYDGSDGEEAANVTEAGRVA